MSANVTKLSPAIDSSTLILGGNESQMALGHFINRDLSLIEFYRGVLDQALDKSNPILERLKFISIFSAILDEFFMIRVSGLKERLGREVGVSLDGLTTSELLVEIKIRISEMIDIQMECLRTEILPTMEREGISIVSFDSLPDNDRQRLNEYFQTSVYPLLTPQAVDPTHPFPYISGGSINLGLIVRPKLTRRSARVLESVSDELFVRIKIPQFIPRLIPVSDGAETFVFIEDILTSNIRSLVPEASPKSCYLFRITRDADIELREQETEDLMESMEETLKLRRFGDVARLEVSNFMPRKMVEYLTKSMDITPEDVYLVNGPLSAGDLGELCKLNRPDLKEQPVKVTVPDIFASGKSTFDIVKQQDILLHHPYMPYSIVTDFIKEAVDDPDVLAIKMCLYRIGAESPIAPLLIEASERGKQVTVVIEIKARFDEANNIEWAKRLEQAGVHVIYGLLGLKTHCKTTLIIRREDDELVRYVHIATGNYNPETSAFYTDLGLLTTNKEIGADATELFNYLTVYSQREGFTYLIVAPINLREKMLELIRREISHAENGRPCGIIAKMNRLADAEIVNALYEASQAGVEIDLIIRGICTLRPGVAGLSENIRVRSIVGSLLEHSRAYCFKNGGNDEIFTGSSDWMPRNLDRRVEVLVPVHDVSLRNYLRDDFLASYLKDNVKARELMPDGCYRKVACETDDDKFDSQMAFQNVTNVIEFGLPGI